MKKISVCIFAAFLSLTFVPAQVNANAATSISSGSAAESAEASKAHTLLLRLDEIKAMDKSKLSSAEKRELRKEVRSTRKYLRESGGGVYLSVGAIIIIVLLLILLL